MGRFADEWPAGRPTLAKAEWERRQVGRGTLRGDRYDRTAPGYYRPSIAGSAQVSSTQRILDAKAAMPAGSLIAGWAAAYVHGIDALDGLDHHTLEPLPVPVLLPPGHHRADSHGMHYRQCKRRSRGDVVEEVPVTTLLRTVFDLARQAPDVTEAVVALDAFLGARRVQPATLQRAVQHLDGSRGIRQARQAVDLARASGVRGRPGCGYSRS